MYYELSLNHCRGKIYAHVIKKEGDPSIKFMLPFNIKIKPNKSISGKIYYKDKTYTMNAKNKLKNIFKEIIKTEKDYFIVLMDQINNIHVR